MTTEQKLDMLMGMVEKLANQIILTTPEAAEYMRCTEDWLRRAAKAGKIEHFLVGRDMRFRKVDLDAYRATPVGQKALDKLRQMREARAY